MWKYAKKSYDVNEVKICKWHNSDNFERKGLILATYRQLGACGNFDFFCDIFYHGNILAVGLWQEHMVVTELNVETLWGARLAHFYTGTILKCSPGFIILHFCTLFTFSSLFLRANTAKWVLATDFTKQIHFRKKLLALLLFWATSISYKARPGKRCKKSFVYNQSIFYSFSVPCVCSVKSTRSCIFRQFTK